MALPVEVSPGVVCTVVINRDASALQLMIHVERDCSVTGMQRLLLTHGRVKLRVNGTAVDDMYQQDALIVADSASVTPHYVLLEHGVAPDAEPIPAHWRTAVGPFVIHSPSHAPLEVHLPVSLSPSGVRHALISTGLLDNAGSIHTPHVCPVIPGIGLHLLLIDPAHLEIETSYGMYDYDLRRAIHPPPLVTCWVAPVIHQASLDYLIEVLHDEFFALGPVLEVLRHHTPSPSA